MENNLNTLYMYYKYVASKPFFYHMYYTDLKGDKTFPFPIRRNPATGSEHFSGQGNLVAMGK